MSFFNKRSAIEIFRSRLLYWIILPVLVSGFLIISYFSGIKDFPVFPNSQNFEYHFFSDSASDGNSKIIKQLITDSIIQIDFRIGNKLSAPYAGINIEPKDTKSLNLGRYNRLAIQLNGDSINGIGIALVTRNHLVNNDIKNQEILYYHIFKIEPEVNLYEISIDKFEVPGWFGEVNRFEDASTIKPEMKNLQTINIGSAFTPNKGQIQTIKISSILFSRNNKPLVIIILALEFGFVLLVFSVLYAFEKIKEDQKTITISYKPIENNSIESSKSDFIGYINRNFQSSELTLYLVSSETGVSQRRITNDIQNRFGCNFKSYINRLRINESKRLLLETDLNIGEIAFHVGFNNQTHFNRVFKSEMQISPTEFRNKHKTDSFL